MSKNKIHKKFPVAANVYDLAIERIEHCFDDYDTVAVSFSGGKDSTVCLQLALEVARSRKRKLEVFHFDEEAIPPETVEYCERVAAQPDIAFRWLCAPIRHRNAASTRSPWWNPWAMEDKAKWTREFPPQGIYDEALRDKSMPDCDPILYPPSRGRVCLIVGIRTQESLNRYMAIAGNKTGHRAYLSHSSAKWITKAYPIYDWTHEDVWLAPELHGWDYNRAYDVMAKAGVSIANQRCAPPYGEQPLERLWTYQVCWPELWAKMCYRVPGAATAARYARTILYGYGAMDDVKHPDTSWKDFILNKMANFNAKDRQTCATLIKSLIEYHEQRSSLPLPDANADPDSGLCWQDIAKVAIRGDLKGGRKTIATIAKANKKADKLKGTRYYGES